MDVVFYLEIGGSFGERVHALSFARGIQAAGYRPRFVVSPRVAEHIRLGGFEPAVFSSPEQGVALARQAAPRMVIGCELFNLSAASARGIVDGDWEIGSIDGTTLSVEINTNPFHLPEGERSLLLPERYALFRPCPVNDVAPDTETVFSWPLFSGASRAEKDARIYDSLGLDPRRRTVLFAVAPWAVKATRLLQLHAYYPEFLKRVGDGLNAWGEPVDLLVVSQGGVGCVTRGSVTLHSVDLLAQDVYDHVLSSCDLIVSDNIIQTSVSKAIVVGTPHLIIQNTTASEVPFRYNIYPLKLMFPPERQYSQIVESAEFGDPGGIRKKLLAIREYGYCDADRHALRRSYVERLGALSEPGAILERVLGRPELGRPEGAASQAS